MDVSAGLHCTVQGSIVREIGSGRSSRPAVIEAAIRCFLDLGYAGASTEAIARRAGVARRTLFNQFASKEALFAAAVEGLWSELELTSAIEAAIAHPEAEAGLLLVGNAIADFWARPDTVPLARLVVAEGERFPFLRDGFDRFGRQPAERALTGYLTELSRRGSLRAPDVELATLQFVSLIKDPLWWPVIMGLAPPPSPKRRRAVVEGAVSMMLSTYGTPTSSAEQARSSSTPSSSSSPPTMSTSCRPTPSTP